MSQLYFSSSRFRSYLPDWGIVLVLFFIFFYITEQIQPFERQFTINDPRLLHPFAKVERVSDHQLYFYSTVLPILIIMISSLLLGGNQFEKYHLAQKSILALLFSVSSVSVLTDILKVWIGNHRPDFIVRCGPKKGTPTNRMVNVAEVCTAPLGEAYLADGMKSTPSGHSSMAFAGLFFLSLWVIGQWKLLSRKASGRSQWHKGESTIANVIVACLPTLLATYIGLSRTQDYRHHFFDVGFGTFLGVLFASLSYWKYFGFTESTGEENDLVDYV
ncbi:hypothetical protein PVL30_000862 [Lodderomyces elongisporus]|uniref:uncharacterized protein n=1 Tax=Lodderomyces elongisporus TaxID=36914 RepID=UPI002926F027|nr:uncharacterized protein PVL30_000862 [Lodderomyces elongisporus]WLF77153.1 hypothetical protein PVL30_000862 [Lodderomyces elongisporus]